MPTPFEDMHRFRVERLMAPGSYHAVVGNPPYITPKDARDNESYRALWSACHLKYQLTVPFTQLFFRLAKTVDDDGRGAGFVGQIVSNAFMKREFGTKLVREFFTTITLSDVIDTSGTYIPGHGTPTVIITGRNAHPRARSTVRAVLGIHGEPGQPTDPERGLVWTAITAQVDHPESESNWVSVVDADRESFATHPWTLSGGGAADLLKSMEENCTKRICDCTDSTGVSSVSGEDDVLIVDTDRGNLAKFKAHSMPVHAGDEIRDFIASGSSLQLVPSLLRSNASELAEIKEHLWSWRTNLAARVYFGQNPFDRGLQWYDPAILSTKRSRLPFLLAFAFVSTHNHFILSRGRTLFKQSALVVQLADDATENAHLELLSVLNSSIACFWMKEMNYGGGGDPVGADGARVSKEPWSERYQFNSTKLEQFPLPELLPLGAGQRLDRLAAKLAMASAGSMTVNQAPTRNLLTDARDKYHNLRKRMIAEQEELDWEVYALYGLLSRAERELIVSDPTEIPRLDLGERAFEIVLARKIAAGQTHTQWFARHGSTPITELPRHWPDSYRRVVENRIALIERRKDIALIERPECKRRWATEPWAKQQERALRTWLLDRFEQRDLWYAPDANGDDQPTPHTVATLADALRADDDVVNVAAMWAQDELQRTDVDLAEIVAALVDAEHVPFLSAYRYKPAGLAKRREWERTWDLQRQEDDVAARFGFDDPTHPEVRERVRKEVGDVPVPPKYGSGDFVRTEYWRHRGKLDVPKERFVSYPAASRDGDGSLLLGWAGWDHREQAQALAVLITTRRLEDAWDDKRITPLVAGLAELMPWVRQWHGEVDPTFGTSPAEAYGGFLDAQVQELGTTAAQLAAWVPDGRVDVAPLPRRRTVATLKERAPRAPREPVDVAHVDAVLAAAANGPLSNEDVRGLTGLDAAGARAVATSLVKDGRLSTTGQRRGTRYILPNE